MGTFFCLTQELRLEMSSSYLPAQPGDTPLYLISASFKE